MGIEEIETKEYFTTGDAARITGVPEYSIRYWEAEFGLIKPIRKQSGHRRYTKADLYNILKIKDLLYRQKLTLEGAKKQLSRKAAPARAEAKTGQPANARLLREIHETLLQILKE